MRRLHLVLCLLALGVAPASVAQRYLSQATSPSHARQLGRQEAGERYSRRLGPAQTGIAFVSSALLGPVGFGGQYFLQVQGTKAVVFNGNEDGLSADQRRLYREYLAGYNETARRNRTSQARKSALVGGLAGLAVFFTAVSLASGSQ